MIHQLRSKGNLRWVQHVLASSDRERPRSDKMVINHVPQTHHHTCAKLSAWSPRPLVRVLPRVATCEPSVAQQLLLAGKVVFVLDESRLCLHVNTCLQTKHLLTTPLSQLQSQLVTDSGITEPKTNT